MLLQLIASLIVLIIFFIKPSIIENRVKAMTISCIIVFVSSGAALIGVILLFTLYPLVTRFVIQPVPHIYAASVVLDLLSCIGLLLGYHLLEEGRALTLLALSHVIGVGMILISFVSTSIKLIWLASTLTDSFLKDVLNFYMATLVFMLLQIVASVSVCIWFGVFRLSPTSIAP